MARVFLTIPTLSGAARVERLVFIRCGTAKHETPHEILVVDNSDDADVADGLPRTTVLHQKRNIGVASSWNLALEYFAERDPAGVLIVANDDINFAPNAFDVLHDQVLAMEHTPYLICGPERIVFAFWACRPQRVLQTVGRFDQQFFPAYWEDNDFEHRMRLAGFDLLHLPHARLGFSHAGSLTTREASEEKRAWFAEQYRANRDRYVAKWGGCPPRGELYLAPYDASRLRGFDDR